VVGPVRDLDRLVDADDRWRTGPRIGVHRGVRRLLRAHPDRDGSRRLAAQPKPANLDPVGSMRDCDGAPTPLSLGCVRPRVINTSRPPG
jgi:hypothetical protein